MFLSIVAVAHNEACNLKKALDELLDVIHSLKSISNYEILFIDCHSDDGSYELVDALNVEKIKCIKLSQRLRKSTAYRVGLELANGDCTLCFSLSGEDDPKVLVEMIEKIENKNDLVWAKQKQESLSFLGHFNSRIIYRLMKIATGVDISFRHFVNADFFLITRKMQKSVNRCKERWTSLFGLLLWMGFKQDYVEYERRSPWKIRKSKDIKNIILDARDWVVSFSGLPLIFATVIGITLAFIGLLYSLYIMLLAIVGITNEGWAETVIFLLVIGGVQLFMLGIIGEYLWRNLDESKNRPLFFVEKHTDNINIEE